MSVNFLIQALCVYVGITTAITCINGTVLASKTNDFRAAAILLATTAISIIFAIIGVHDLIIAGTFGLSGRIIASTLVLLAVCTAYGCINKANKLFKANNEIKQNA